MFHIVKDPMDSLLDKYWWVPRAQAIYQPHLRSGLAHDIHGEKTTVFCKIKEDKKTMQKKEREREREENRINFKCKLSLLMTISHWY